MRWPVSQRSGVVPVSWTNRRAKVRSDMCARAASWRIVTGSLRCRCIQPMTSPSVSQAGTATGRSTYWAWPPSRCGGTTIRRAIPLATRVPCSLRTRCRHASMPAAVPALVITRPSSTYSTSGLTIADGYRWASSAACRQCVVQCRPSSRPAAPSANAPLHTLSTRVPRSTAARSASISGAGNWREAWSQLAVTDRRDHHQVGGGQPVQAVVRLHGEARPTSRAAPARRRPPRSRRRAARHRSGPRRTPRRATPSSNGVKPFRITTATLCSMVPMHAVAGSCRQMT